MSLAQWELLLQAVRGYHRTVERSVGPDRGVRSNIIWHGGEPLLLPTRYFEDVFALEREVLSDVDHRNVLQSNLYVMPSRTMDVLEQEHVQLGVSFDLVPGVRLARDGSTTEEAVAANIERLQARGVQLGAVVVLAGHTAPHVRRIYDFFAGRDLPVRFLPMFDAPLNTPEAAFALSEAATVRTLQQLFRHWMRATPCRRRGLSSTTCTRHCSPAKVRRVRRSTAPIPASGRCWSTPTGRSTTAPTRTSATEPSATCSTSRSVRSSDRSDTRRRCNAIGRSSRANATGAGSAVRATRARCSSRHGS